MPRNRTASAYHEGLEQALEMAKVEIYVSPFCGYCHRAKDLLAARGAAVTEIDVVANCERRQEMMARAGGRRTVPQIFIDRSEEHTSELQSLMRISYAVFCWKTKKQY